MGEDDAAIVTATITITRMFHPERDNPEHTDTIRVDTTGDPSLFDMLGMLEFAKLDVITPAIRDDDE